MINCSHTILYTFPAMLDHFIYRINEAVENIEWMKKREMTDIFWHKNCIHDIYFYLDLLQTEPDIESYDY